MTLAATIRLLLDQGIPRDAASLLRARARECIHVGEIGMSDATDDAILAIAAEKLAIVVTIDADFHTIAAVSGRSRPSVIRIRMQGLGASEISELIQQVLIDFSADLLQGALITIKARKTTCHRLRSAARARSTNRIRAFSACTQPFSSLP